MDGCVGGWVDVWMDGYVDRYKHPQNSGNLKGEIT